LALGPLTNIATLALSRPDLIDRIGTLTWMGGSVTGGNHTASAEFNAAADPEAVAIVLEHGLPLRMVDLDFCRGVIVTLEDVAPIRAAGGRNAALLADLLAGYVEIGTSRGRPGSALYDPVAAFALARSGSVIFHPAQITVELAGTHTRGRTVVETRPHRARFNAEFAADGDLVEARQAILDVLEAEAAK
ncbi:nucleoside hydrolase, partial [Thioclava sp. BHET1]